jgi:hypothetical protein
MAPQGPIGDAQPPANGGAQILLTVIQGQLQLAETQHGGNGSVLPL